MNTINKAIGDEKSILAPPTFIANASLDSPQGISIPVTSPASLPTFIPVNSSYPFNGANIDPPSFVGTPTEKNRRSFKLVLALLLLLFLLGGVLYYTLNNRLNQVNDALVAADEQAGEDRETAGAKPQFNQTELDNLSVTNFNATNADIGNLSSTDTTIKNLTVTGSTNLADFLPKTAQFNSTTTGSTNSGNTVTDTLLVRREATVGGSFNVYGPTTLGGSASIAGNTTIGGNLIAPNAVIANGNINNANINSATIGTLTTTGSSSTAGQAIFTGLPSGALVNQGTVYINPASAAATDTLLGLAVNGVQKLRVDASGNIYGNNLILTGGTTTSGNTIVNNLEVLDSTILGNASSDTLTVNAGSTFNNSVNIAGANPFSVGTGSTFLGGSLTANGATSLGGTLGVTGATSLGSTLNVSGLSTFTTLGAADTSSLICRNSSNQLASCNTTGVGAVFIQGGNSFGGLATLGTNDANALAFETGGTERVRIDTSGNVGIGIAPTGSAGLLQFASGTTAASGINFGTDTNLYRSAADSLKTDDLFKSASNIVARDGAAGQVQLYTGNGTGGISFGLASDAVLYRYDANNLQTDSGFRVNKDAAVGLNNTGKLYFGSALDTNLYRFAADTLKTDDRFVVDRPSLTDSAITVRANGNNSLNITADGNLSWADGVGGSIDTILYRAASGLLKAQARLTVQPAANSTTAFQIQNAAGTSNLLVADTTNTRIGIGTAAPAYLLDVQGGSGIVAQFSGRVIGGNAVNSNEFTTKSQLDAVTSGTAGAFIQGGNSFGGLATLGTNDNFGLALETNNIERLRIDTSGNVGIGMSNPTARLDISGAGVGVGSGLLRTNGDIHLGTSAAAGGLFFGTNGYSYASGDYIRQSAAGRIDIIAGGTNTTAAQLTVNNGNVGIGTTSPAHKLHVVGSGLFTSNIYGVHLSNSSSANNANIAINTTGTVITRNIADANPVLIAQNSNASSTGDIFQAKNSASTLFVIGQTGNVGIGRSSPSSLLHLSSAVDPQTNKTQLANYQMAITSTKAAAVGVGPGLAFHGNTGNTVATYLFGMMQGIKSSSVADNYEGSLTFSTTNSAGGVAERLRIDGAGNVGIGTTGPGNKLELAASTSSTGGIGFGTDTNLYRSAVDTLKTDDNFIVGGTGLFKNAADSTTAFQIQNSTGTALLTADTTNMKLTVQNLVITANLTVNGHIITGGTAPTTAVNGNAGTGASCTVNGTDTTGTITVTTGTGTVTAGTLCTITFNTAYGVAPRVVVGAKGSASAPLDPYSDGATTTNFNVGTAAAAAVSTTYTFDYITAQ